MKVKELIEKLKNFDPELSIYSLIEDDNWFIYREKKLVVDQSKLYVYNTGELIFGSAFEFWNYLELKVGTQDNRKIRKQVKATPTIDAVVLSDYYC